MSTKKEDYKVDVPEGSSGPWRIDHLTVTKEMADAERLRQIATMTARGVPEGIYTRLLRGQDVIMSDTPDEIRDHYGLFFKATGRVLIAGLGLGMAARGVLLKQDVTHVTVIEKSPDVITLVAPWLTKKFGPKRLQIIEADIFTWPLPPEAKWDCAWFDIWDNICGDNYDDMKKLNRRFARRVPRRLHWAEYEVKRVNARWNDWLSAYR